MKTHILKLVFALALLLGGDTVFGQIKTSHFKENFSEMNQAIDNYLPEQKELAQHFILVYQDANKDLSYERRQNLLKIFDTYYYELTTGKIANENLSIQREKIQFLYKYNYILNR